jgi:hypothetical protein
MGICALTDRLCFFPLLLSALEMFGPTAAPPSTEVDVVGFVLEVRGSWCINGSAQLLERGAALRQGDRLQVRAPYDVADSITLVGGDGETIQMTSCREPGRCNRPVPLEALRRGQDPLRQRMVRVVMKLWRQQPDRYATFGNRGADNELRDSVVAADGRGLVLAPVLGALHGGHYLLHLEPLLDHDRKRFGAVPVDLEVDLTAGAGPAWVVAAPAPGLYRLDVTEVRPAGRALGPEAWILVAPQGSYQKLSAAFRPAAELAARWQEQAGPDVARRFVRAFLVDLATGADE